jgi:hypothetical protein
MEALIGASMSITSDTNGTCSSARVVVGSTGGSVNVEMSGLDEREGIGFMNGDAMCSAKKAVLIGRWVEGVGVIMVFWFMLKEVEVDVAGAQGSSAYVVGMQAA